jgi:transcriptional regulator with XRE-family HTH domain
MGGAELLAAGSLILMARQEAGMSQDELAAAAGTSQPAISAYETGRRQPTVPVLYKIIAAAGSDLRMRLEPKDDHDETLAQLEALRTPAERADWAAEQDRWMLVNLERLS